MKSEKKILVAFILNLFFSIFEFFGGILTNSVAIMSDSVHDFGDAMSVGISFFLEKKSKKKPDEKFTYGYLRYSIFGSIITTIILLIGSIFVIYNSIKRIINPVIVNYSGMIIFAIVGVLINGLAVYFTHEGDSLNQKSVNLHMLEDVLGWVVVLIGAIIMNFTDISIIDPILSILVALFILISALKNMNSIVDLLLEKAPKNISIKELKEHLLEIDDVINIHHIHLWSLDGINNYATIHVVYKNDAHIIKCKIREELMEHGINHVTIETESENEECDSEKCKLEYKCNLKHHHH